MLDHKVLAKDHESSSQPTLKNANCNKNKVKSRQPIEQIESIGITFLSRTILLSQMSVGVDFTKNWGLVLLNQS